jgi:hypothetical protein
LRVAFTRSVVTAWVPERALAGAHNLIELAELVSDRGSRTPRAIAGLRDSHTWSGQAQSAASDWSVTEHARTEDVSRKARSLAAVVDAELRAVADCRLALLQAVAAAEADGGTVDEHWSVLGVGDDGALQKHGQGIRCCLTELVRADAQAAQAVARGLDAFGVDGDIHGFVPVAIGLAFLIDAAVAALISAGVLSVGAILFALVDEFGIDAWDTIESAVPSSFFEDAGPVDSDHVRDRLADATLPGRNPPIRQVETEQQLRDLWDALTAEGRVVEDVRYPGQVVELPDGTQVRLRDNSKSGGPTIDIKYPDGGKDKVHIE